MRKGEIYRIKHRSRNPHMAVLLEDPADNGGLIEAAIFTHDNRHIQTMPEHFCEVNAVGQRYQFQWDKTYLVPWVFLKDPSIIIEPCIGCVTQAGMMFLKNKLNGIEPVICDGPIWNYNPDK